MGLAFMQVVGLSRDVWLRGASRDEPPRILRKFRITPRHAGRPDPHVAVCVLPVRMLETCARQTVQARVRRIAIESTAGTTL
jgi:hypothetical protein